MRNNKSNFSRVQCNIIYSERHDLFISVRKNKNENKFEFERVYIYMMDVKF